ncbi:MAG: guanylate kinase [Bacteroidales bacterium]|nr:guanylate kinase [Bacteroidales bacterium]
MSNKVIIFCAPSGSGKSTIVQHLIAKYPIFEFSISATTRAPRGQEQDGREYYFLSPERFRELVSQGAFVEYEEVYPGCIYGSLRSELERLWAKGSIVLFDIDVCGGVNLKRIFGDDALAVFIKAPSIASLRERLKGRGTDTPEAIEQRVAKAETELSYQDKFDVVLVNDNLEKALADAEALAEEFIARP